MSDSRRPAIPPEVLSRFLHSVPPTDTETLVPCPTCEHCETCRGHHMVTAEHRQRVLSEIPIETDELDDE